MQGLYTMARNNTRTAAAATATVATPALQPRALRPVPTNAGKYGATHAAVAIAQVLYSATAAGTAGASGATKAGGKLTAMGLVCAAHARATRYAARFNGGVVKGAYVVAAMRALYRANPAWRTIKANSYAGPLLPVHSWCVGYVNGAKRNGLLAAA